MHKEKNFLLDEQILSFQIDPHLRKAAKIYGTTSTDPDQFTETVNLKGTHKVSQKVVPLHNDFMALLCSYLCNIESFFR